ncbi:YveK family protein [Blastococcus sp. SYSU D00922]
MEFIDYLNAIRRHWPFWVVPALLGVALAAALVQLSSPTYEARAEVFVAGSSTGSPQLVAQRVKSYPDVASSRAVLAPVMDQLQLDAPFAEVQEQVRASNPVDTSQIVITATSASPEQAAALANAVADEFTEVVQTLERTESGPPPVTLTVTDPATEPTSPSGVSSIYVLALGLCVGLLLGLALAVIRGRSSTALYDESDVRAAWDEDAADPAAVPVLTAPRGRARRSRLAGDPARGLARRLEVMAENRPVRILMLSPSPSAAEHRAVAKFAAAVATELDGHRVSSSVSEYSAPAATRDPHPNAQVRLHLGDPLAPLRTWREVARECTGVVLVVRSGRVAAAELRELQGLLRTAGITTLAVVVIRRRRGRSRSAEKRRPPARTPADDPRAASARLLAGVRPGAPAGTGGADGATAR